MSSDTERTNLGREDVERRAYELYEQRGREHGHDCDDWLAGERELRASGAAETTERFNGGRALDRTTAPGRPLRA